MLFHTWYIWKHTPCPATIINMDDLFIALMAMVRGSFNGNIDMSSGNKIKARIILFGFLVLSKMH